LQYGDFALWQRARFSGARADRLRAYWREKLRDLPTLEAPADFRRPVEATEIGATEWFDIPSALAAGLDRLAKAEAVSLFTVMLSAFQCLLSRYTGATDIPLAVPVSERTDTNLEGLVGFFV